ncbi:cytochrome c family protein [Reyranella sp.]|jgi:cytochrome c|uniref:c-type cytochrome n=1 Tax=Reyranella sp. TaxID=1929291 RepID=UPI002F94A196
MNKLVAIATVLPIVGWTQARAQDVEAGEKVFKQCTICHMVGENAKNRVGPVLNGLEGRKAGTIAGFSYSNANKSSGVVWTKAEFLDYIRDPKAKIPGTKMIFAGVKDEGQANALWSYLAQFDADGKKK